MKGPGIKDYIEAIKQCKEQGRNEGKEFIEISSKELHGELSKEFATMPTCCQALYKCMLQGDEILQSPKGKTGFGSHLRIRFYLNEEGREPYFEAKRRGRPPKENGKEEAKYHFKKGGDELPSLINEWLEERGWQTSKHARYIEASKSEKKWYIDIYQTTRGRKMPLSNKISDVIKKMEDDEALYSVALVDSPIYRKQWEELPSGAKKRLQVSVILADHMGNVVEIK